MESRGGWMKNLVVLLAIALLAAGLLAESNVIPSAQQEEKGRYYNSTTAQEQAPEPINGVANAIFGQQASEEPALTVATRSVPPWPQDLYSEQYSEEDDARKLLVLGRIVLLALVASLLAWKLLSRKNAKAKAKVL